jgi:hypothetical protein
MNKKILSAVLAAFLTVVFFDLKAAAQGEIPFRLKKVADRVTIFSPGQYAPEAVAVFEMNAEAFPESWNFWDSLGAGNANSRDIYWVSAEAMNRLRPKDSK